MSWEADDAWDSSSDTELGPTKSHSRVPARPAPSIVRPGTPVAAPVTTEPSSWTLVEKDLQSPTSGIFELSLNGGSAALMDDGVVVDAPESDEDEEDNEDIEITGKEAIRDDIHEILIDPLTILKEAPNAVSPPSSPSPQLPSTPSTPVFAESTPSKKSATSSSQIAGNSNTNKPPATPKTTKTPQRSLSIRASRRRTKFLSCLQSTPQIDISLLRSLAWSGIPASFRPIAWQLLLGYLPLPAATRKSALKRKRDEYQELVKRTFDRGKEGLDSAIWHQISIDIPRTRPGVPLWACPTTQRSLERVLYIWAIRHPASGYVQGINDLLTPFFQVFLSSYLIAPSSPNHYVNPENFDSSFLPTEVIDAVEADSFWCLSKLLDGIQDNYIFAQPGIRRLVGRMSELVARIDPPLAQHLEDQGVEFMQFAFRWMNCLLMREISMNCTIRMWDTYLAEGTEAFSQFHLYVCSAFLVKWSATLLEMDFQGIIIFLQSLPTSDWSDHEIELLLSEAFVLKSVWQGAENHFSGGGGGGGGGEGKGSKT